MQAPETRLGRAAEARRGLARGEEAQAHGSAELPGRAAEAAGAGALPRMPAAEAAGESRRRGFLPQEAEAAEPRRAGLREDRGEGRAEQRQPGAAGAVEVRLR